jgi:hypothetical protein
VAALLLAGSDVIGDEKQEKAVSLVDRQSATGGLEDWSFFSEDDDARWSEVWKLDGDVLVCAGSPKGYIYTQKDYQDFILRLQWRWPPGKPAGRGGVLIRMTGQHQIWPKSLEAQINATQAGDFWGLNGFKLQGPPDRMETLSHGEFGELIHVTRTKDAEKPAGQWNQYEIIAQGATVTLKINGQVVNRATRCDTVAGKICLTAEGDEIHFRRIELVAHAADGT